MAAPVLPAAWFQPAPWSLVGPDLSLHIIPDVSALIALSRKHGMQPNNMRHLIGFYVGNGEPRHVKSWKRLDQLQWIARDDDVAVAVSG